MGAKTIILTGGTGVFGKFIVEDLLKTESNIILLVRADSQRQFHDRAKKLLRAFNDPLGSKITVLRCDLTLENLGLSNKDCDFIKKKGTHIFHAAASTRFNLPLAQARRNNVTTTKNLLSFATHCENLDRFAFVSTAFVAGKRSGTIFEEEFEHTEGFLNTYEQSKYEAEELVRLLSKELPVVIFRPSLVLTPLRKSGTNPVNALSLGLFLAREGFLPVLPGNKSNRLDIIEGTIASKAITQLFLKERLKYLTYHITSAQNSPQLKGFLDILERKSKKKIPIRFCGDMESYLLELKKATRLRPDLTAIYKKTQTFLPELAFPKIYDNKNLLDELGVTTFSEKPMNSVVAILK